MSSIAKQEDLKNPNTDNPPPPPSSATAVYFQLIDSDSGISDDDADSAINNGDPASAKRPRVSDGEIPLKKPKLVNDILPLGFLDPLPSEDAPDVVIAPSMSVLPPPLHLPQAMPVLRSCKQFWKAGDYIGQPVADSNTIPDMNTPDPPGPSRRRPRVLKKRHSYNVNQGHSSITQAQIKQGEENVEYGVSDMSKELAKSFPGGPDDISILKSFSTHIAACIWKKREREPLKCQYHGSKLCDWAWNANTPNRLFQRYIRESGLQILLDISYRNANRLLVSAFVERWQPETNTFHMPFGEMTITLDDVSTLVGIPVMGRSVSIPQLTSADAVELMVWLLGVSSELAKIQLNQVRGQSVGLEWLRVNFSNVTDADPEERIRCAARAYLLYMVGCTIFSDKSGNRVSISYLGLFEDLSRVSSFAWGAAVLAYLFRQLGYASRAGVKQIAGYMPLLEAWIYEHFPSVRPLHNPSYTIKLPRACMWASRGATGTSMENLKALRESLDSLRVEEVVWNPYRDCRDHHPLLEISFFTGCIKCIDIVEIYHPERVLRQFGRIQIIPPFPIPPYRVKRGYTSQAYQVTYACIDHLRDRWRNHVLKQEERSVEVIYPWDAVDGYLDWYRRISHPIIQNPFHQSAVAFGRTRGTDVDAAVLMQRISDAMRISKPTIQRGFGSEHSVSELYHTIYSMRQVLEGVETGPSKIPVTDPESKATTTPDIQATPTQ